MQKSPDSTGVQGQDASTVFKIYGEYGGVDGSMGLDGSTEVVLSTGPKGVNRRRFKTVCIYELN